MYLTTLKHTKNEDISDKMEVLRVTGYKHQYESRVRHGREGGGLSN